MTWNRYLGYFLRAVKRAGISESILFTCSPHSHFERGTEWKRLASFTIDLFNNETLTPQQRIESFCNFKG